MKDFSRGAQQAGMTARLARFSAPLLGALIAGCGSKADSGYSLDVGADEGGFSFGPSVEAGAAGAFDAHIERGGITVTFVTVGCSGPCADVVAVATGGRAPYSYAWDDGSTSAARHLCPTSTTSYRVKVSDTGTTGELARPSQTVQVPLAASVIACPDSGTPDGGWGAVCLSNPSFEGPPANATVDAPPWVACGNQATIENPSLPAPAQPLLQPTDGTTALFLRAQVGSPPPGAVSEPLCATMRAGTTYHLTVDVGSTPEATFGVSAPPEGLQIWGGSTSCSEGELLWSSPLAGPTWTTYCATLTPTQDTTYLTLVAYQDPDAGVPLSLGNLQADHLVPVAACP